MTLSLPHIIITTPSRNGTSPCALENQPMPGPDKKPDGKSDSKKEAEEKLWIETEKKIATVFDPEDLRTSGILAGRQRRWSAALVRCGEAAEHGLRDSQLLDTLGEAAYRTKTPETLLPYHR